MTQMCKTGCSYYVGVEIRAEFAFYQHWYVFEFHLAKNSLKPFCGGNKDFTKKSFGSAPGNFTLFKTNT